MPGYSECRSLFGLLRRGGSNDSTAGFPLPRVPGCFGNGVRIAICVGTPAVQVSPTSKSSMDWEGTRSNYRVDRTRAAQEATRSSPGRPTSSAVSAASLGIGRQMRAPETERITIPKPRPLLGGGPRLGAGRNFARCLTEAPGRCQSSPFTDCTCGLWALWSPLPCLYRGRLESNGDFSVLGLINGWGRSPCTERRL
jgi:hypothetical protein